LASDGTAGDQFGWSVDLSGDRAIVGAPFANSEFSGAAYVFQRQGANNWVEIAKLRPNGAATDDRFGWSVGLSGTTAIVGAPFRDSASGDGDTGAAYVFEIVPEPSGFGLAGIGFACLKFRRHWRSR
jgi:hypothetical protein